MIVDECPCNLCSSFRVYGADEELVVLLSVVVGLTCPDDDNDDDDCDRAAEKGDVMLYK